MALPPAVCAPDFRRWYPVCLWWSLVGAAAILLKLHYRVADENRLQWMLAPLVFLVELLTPYEFDRLANGVFLNGEFGVAIVKGCAGVNFMVMCLLVAASHTSPARQGGGGGLLVVRKLSACLVASWGVALGVNSLRIVLVMQVPIHEFYLAGVSDAALHTWLGIGVFLSGLVGFSVWLDSGVGWRGVIRGLGVYAAVLVGVPVLTPLCL